LGASLAVLDFLHLGSTLSLRSFCRLGSSMALLGISRMGSSLAVLDCAHLGSSMSLRSLARLGSSLSVLDFLHLGLMPSTPWVPQTVDGNGKTYGARMKPTCLSKFCHPPCAISGYETGDPCDGICKGQALIALLLHLFCCIGGSLYALAVWKPDPSKITGDGTQRTLNSRLCAAIGVGGPCAVAFWENGDICTGCCQGDACIALIIRLFAELLSIPCADVIWVWCLWQPNEANFVRNAEMDGGGTAPVQAPVIGNAVIVGEAVK